MFNHISEIVGKKIILKTKTLHILYYDSINDTCYYYDTSYNVLRDTNSNAKIGIWRKNCLKLDEITVHNLNTLKQLKFFFERDKPILKNIRINKIEPLYRKIILREKLNKLLCHQ